MSLFRFPYTWAALGGRAAGSRGPGQIESLQSIVPELDDRDRAIEDYLASVAGESGNDVVSYATGGVQITYAGTYKAAPVPTYNIEAPAGVHPYGCYVGSATATGFKAFILDGNGVEVGAGGAIRIFWHARPAGA